MRRFGYVVAALAVLLVACQPTDAKPGASGSGTATASASGSGGSIAMPSVTGKRLSDAIQTLVGDGFIRISSQDGTPQHRTVVDPANWVVRQQDPAAGTRGDKGTKITLTVLKPTDGAGGGVSTIGVVPNVTCKDLKAAKDTLHAAGFPQILSTDGTGKGRTQLVDGNWIVINQSAAAGSKPAQSTQIVLTVVKFGEATGNSGCKS